MINNSTNISKTSNFPSHKNMAYVRKIASHNKNSMEFVYVSS